MNAEQLLNQIEDAIKTRPVPHAKRFWLVFKEGRFLCLPQTPSTGTDSIIAELTRGDCEKGLSTKQWARLLTKLANIEKEKTE